MSLTPADAQALRHALATVVVVPVTPLSPDGPLPADTKDEIRGILREWDLT